MHGEGGMHGKGGHVWQRGACMAKGGMHGEGGVHDEGGCVVKGGHAWLARWPLQQLVCILLEWIFVSDISSISQLRKGHHFKF